MQGAVAESIRFVSPGAQAEGSLPPSVANPHGPAAAKSEAPAPTGMGAQVSSKRSPRRRTLVYVGIAVAVVAILIVLAYALTGGFHHPSGSPSGALLPSGTSYAMNAKESAGVTFTVTTTSLLQGTFQTGGPVVLYTMSPTEFANLVKTGNLSGYTWTSSQIPSQSYYNLDVSMAPGSWALVFFNPSAVNPTAVTFYTSVTLTPT